MRIDKQLFKCTTLTALLLTSFAAGGIAQNTNAIASSEQKSPAILTISPTDGEIDVDRSSVIKITFNSEMDAASLNSTTLLLHATYADTLNDEHGMMQGHQMIDKTETGDPENSLHYSSVPVNGTLSYSNKVATFTPDEELKTGTLYTFTVTNGVKNAENIALDEDRSWSFTTIGKSYSTYSDDKNDKWGMERTENSSIYAMSSPKVNTIDLGKAGYFVILAKTSVKNNSASQIIGHIGEGLVADSANKEEKVIDPAWQTPLNRALVLQSNQTDTTSPDVTEAIEDMMSAFRDASIQNGDDSTSHKKESFHDTVLTSGVHEWSNSVNIVSDVTLSGSANDVWLFKVGENLTVDENIVFTLTNGAQADNIFWYVEGEVAIGKNAYFEGIILSMKEITLGNGANLNGRMFSQTSITLDNNTVTEPSSMSDYRSSINR